MQGMIVQRPGVLLDSLVGAPGLTRATEGFIVNSFLRRLDEVSSACCHFYLLIAE